MKNASLIKYAAESLITLTVCKLIIVFLPFRFWSAKCGQFQCETLKEDMLLQADDISAIQRSVQWVAKRLPWHSKCLDQALAVQYMLARRKLPTTIYFGMKKGEHNKWIAHAWVRCGDRWVVGYQPRADYTVVGTYAAIPTERR